MGSDKSFIGRGWSFPPAFDKASKGVSMLEEEADIESSLEILLSTRLGERIMQPNYGCNLDEMVFEAMNLTMLTYLKDLVENAILYFEPRIELEGLEIDTSRETEGLLLILIDYKVRITNSRFNYVYPFYKNEGINLQLSTQV
ncbi:MAG: GPW/gp25 family protein [Bacteroidales bacterium]|nr:GPW/gp25 family protein [Bacteroidales bacterium]